MEKYNGWKNRQTWSVALYINNEPHLYYAAVDYMKSKRPARGQYMRFIRAMGLVGVRNGDNISYSGTRLDYPALNAMMQEIGDNT